MKTLAIKRGEDKRLSAGHPWVFSNEVKSPLKEFEPGEMVRLTSAGGRPIGVGYVNPRSLICVRVLSTDASGVEDGFVKKRIAAALRLRRSLYPDSKVYRLVYGESDALPGLIVDRYGGNVCMQTLTAGMELLKREALDAVLSLLSPEVVVARDDAPYRELEGLPREKSVLHGEWRGPVQVSVDGVKMLADLMDGQKTGLFLDQRENLGCTSAWARGARVLDCFSYTGAWGIHALLAGAASVTAVDASAKALEDARQNAQANSVEDRWTSIEGDAFKILEKMPGGPRFDIAVLDPPAFVKRKDRLAAARRRYRDINQKAISTLRPGGTLVSCSCSHHLDRPAFKQLLNEAATRAGRRAIVVQERGQSRDHPVLLAARETDYLKCLVLRIL
jgi:23S rRNA (cytosine1962-C5)-methyltransferase